MYSGACSLRKIAFSCPVLFVFLLLMSRVPVVLHLSMVLRSWQIFMYSRADTLSFIFLEWRHTVILPFPVI